LVITLPAKAGSFSGHAPPIGARSVLKAIELALQGIHREFQLDDEPTKMQWVADLT
jgi:hypothetical protein